MKKYTVSALFIGAHGRGENIVYEHWEYIGVKRAENYTDIIEDYKNHSTIRGLKIKDSETKAIVFNGKI